MPRNYGIMSGRLTRGASRQPSAAGADTRADSKILQFARRDISLPFRVDYRDSSLGPFIPGSILIEPPDPSLPPPKLFQTMVDVFVLFFWGFLTLLLAAAIYGAIFILIFFATY